MTVQQAYTLIEGEKTLPTRDDKDVNEMIRTICLNGLKRRGLAGKQEYIDRLDEELDLIIGKDFSVYFIILWDALRWCRNNGIFIGRGRGSAAGSLVAYVMDITDVDPLEYGLLFWRFLSDWRSEFPDIDTDIADRDRKRLIAFLQEKYGHDNVASLITFIYFSGKSAFKAAAKVLAVPFKEANDATKDIPDGASVEIFRDAKFKGFFEKYRGVYKLAKALEGRLQTTGTHAAATVITDKALSQLVSLESQKLDGEDDRNPVISIPKDAAEDLGLIKYDFLGLKTLSVVADCIELVKRNHGKLIDHRNMKFDDPDVLKMVSDGDTVGLFQAEASASTRVIKDMGIDNFLDLVASNALVRPGAMKVIGKDYVARKRGHQKITYPHPITEAFLEDTFGLCVYEDQKIFTDKGLVRAKDLSVGMSVLGDAGENIIIDKRLVGKKDIYKIVTTDGRNLLVSPEHPIMTSDGWKRADELSTSDYLVLDDPSLLSETGGLSVDEATALAGWISEGSLTDTAMAFSNNDEEILSVMESAIEKAFAGTSTRRYFHCRSNYIAVRKKEKEHRKASDAVEFVRGLGLFGTTSHTKFIPVEVFRSSQSARLAFLGMYLSCDGTNFGNGASFRTVSEDIAVGLEMLLRQSGCSRAGISRDDFGFIVSIYDKKWFNSTLSPYIPGHKSSNLSGESYARRFPNEMMRDHQKMSGITTRKWAESFSIPRCSLGNGKEVSYTHYSKIGIDLRPMDRVKSVEVIGTENCYDIQVTGDHTFSISGVITHNCLYQEQMLQICTELAGLTKEEADKIRKLTAKKKDKALLDPFREKFIAGTTEKVGQKVAEKLWHDIETTAEYQFNKCLALDTMVTVKYGEIPNGKTEQMTVGQLYARMSMVGHRTDFYVLGPEKIKSRSTEGEKWHKVKGVYDNGVKDIVRVWVSESEYIDSTFDHKHRMSKGWKEARRIHQMDRIATRDGMKTVWKKTWEGQTQTFDIELYDEPHAFFANGFVTHNSHSVAYSQLTYITAMLKYRYPAEFMCAILMNEKDKISVSNYLSECKRLGVPVRTPHVNKSGIGYDVRDGVIYMGLSNIKQISDVRAQKIILGRPYTSYEDLKSKITAKGSGMGKMVMDSLEAIGATEFPDHPVDREACRDNYFEYLGIATFDNAQVTPKMRERLTPLDEYEDKTTDIVVGIVQKIESKNGWTRVDFVDETGQCGFFVNKDHPFKKGHKYILCIAGGYSSSIVGHLDLSDFSANNAIVRYLTGEFDDDNHYLISAKMSQTKKGTPKAELIVSYRGRLIPATAWSDTIPMARKCRTGDKIRFRVKSDKTWGNTLVAMMKDE